MFIALGQEPRLKQTLGTLSQQITGCRQILPAVSTLLKPYDSLCVDLTPNIDPRLRLRTLSADQNKVRIFKPMVKGWHL